jgi:glycosyltransferase involved in cell wall biosynthesis
VKILFDHGSPFLLAHGGFQIQIEQTIAAVKAIGMEAEHLLWWDDSQRGNVIHYFGRPAPGYVTSAQRKGLKVVIAPLLSGMGSRPRSLLFLQKLFVSVCRSVLPPMVTAPFGWNSFRFANGCIANTPWEAHLMSYILGALPQNVHVVPNGIEEVFSNSPHVERGTWLVCTATITERKRVLELSRAAIVAQTPMWIIGKAYSESDPYARAFFELARSHPKIIRYEGPIQDRQKLAQAYRQARGFVLLSARETLSLSAFEAAACECPLLLTDLPWAKTTFKECASYCPVTSAERTARVLRAFYEAAPNAKLPPKPASWLEIAQQFKAVYERVASTSR